MERIQVSQQGRMFVVMELACCFLVMRFATTGNIQEEEEEKDQPPSKHFPRSSSSSSMSNQVTSSINLNGIARFTCGLRWPN